MEYGERIEKKTMEHEGDDVIIVIGAFVIVTEGLVQRLEDGK